MSSANQSTVFRRPFHVEPRNIVEDSAQERVSAEASVLNSRVHYYGRLTASSDRLLVICVPSILSPANDFIRPLHRDLSKTVSLAWHCGGVDRIALSQLKDLLRLGCSHILCESFMGLFWVPNFPSTS